MEPCCNTAERCHVGMPVINVECHLYASFLRLRIVHSLIHDAFYCICAECPGSEVYKKKRHSKIWHISHIVWMFYQHVAGSLTWITTAVQTAASLSLSFCSSKCQFSFLSPCLLSSARRENVTSIFVRFEKMQSRMTVSKICQRDITKPIG